MAARKRVLPPPYLLLLMSAAVSLAARCHPGRYRAPLAGMDVPGYVYICIESCSGVLPAAGLVSVQASIPSARWSSSTGAIEATSEGSMRFNETFRVPTHWSLRQRTVPVLSALIMAQSSILHPQSTPIASVRVPLAALITQPNQILEATFPATSSSVVAPAAAVRLKIQFKPKSDRSTPFKLSARLPSTLPQQQQQGRLHVHVVSAQRMRGMSAPFVRMRVDGGAGAATRQDLDGGEEPTWNEHFMLPVRARIDQTPMLHVDVIDASGRTLTTLLPILSRVTIQGHIMEGTFPLIDADARLGEKKRVEIRLSVQWISDSNSELQQGDASSATEVWSVTAVAARNLVQRGWSGSKDVYVRVVPVAGSRELVDFAKEASVACDVDDQPLWNERLSMTVPRGEGDISFDVAVYNDNFMDADDAEIGHCVVSAEHADRWHAIKNLGSKVGDVHIIVRKDDSEPLTDAGTGSFSSGYLHVSSVSSYKLRRNGLRLHDASISLSTAEGFRKATMTLSDNQGPAISWGENFVIPLTSDVVERGLCITAIAGDTDAPFAEGIASFTKESLHEAKTALSTSTCELRGLREDEDEPPKGDMEA